MPGNQPSTHTLIDDGASQLENVTIEVVGEHTMITGEGYGRPDVGTVPDMPKFPNLYRNGEVYFSSILIKPGLMYHKITIDNDHSTSGLPDMYHSYAMINNMFEIDGEQQLSYEIYFDESVDYDENGNIIYDSLGMQSMSHHTDDFITIYDNQVDHYYNVPEEYCDVNSLIDYLQSNIETSNIVNRKFGSNTEYISNDSEMCYGKHNAKIIVDSATLMSLWREEVNINTADARKKIQ